SPDNCVDGRCWRRYTAGCLAVRSFRRPGALRCCRRRRCRARLRAQAAGFLHELAPRAGRYNLRSSKPTTCCGSPELLMRRGECCFGGWRRCACGHGSDLVVLSSANLVAQIILCIDTFSISQGAVHPPTDWIVLLRSVPLMPQVAAADCVLVVSSVSFLCL
uniref:Uncharacterized protein n=1 Tax=Aegilops tauschii subsp. strangulata TaxID=200361 RepID=A0A453MZR5_AEGTS